MDKICGLDDRFEMLNERLTLIEKTVGINSYMSIGEGNVGNVGNVGVGSTAPASKYGPGSQVPPDVARYQELVAAQAAGNVGIGSTGQSGPSDDEIAKMKGQVAGGKWTDPVPDTGNVGVGNTAPGESQRERIERRAQERAEETARSFGNVGSGESTETQSLCPPNPSESTETQSLCPPNPSEADGWPRSDGNVGEK